MNNEELNQKALGDPLKGTSRRVRKGSTARFDPKAIDGDNDGVVQEGTQFARPAAPNIKKPRALRGATPNTKPRVAGVASRTQADIDKEVSKEITDMVSEVLSRKSPSSDLRSVVRGLGPDGGTELTKDQEDRINAHIDAFDAGDYENNEDFMSDIANVLKGRPSGAQNAEQSKIEVNKKKISKDIDSFLEAKKMEDMPKFAQDWVRFAIFDRKRDSDTDTPEYKAFRDAFDLSMSENGMNLNADDQLIGYLDASPLENSRGVSAGDKEQAQMLARAFNKPAVVEAYKKALGTDILNQGSNNASPAFEDFGDGDPSIPDKLKVSKALGLKMPEEAKRRSSSPRMSAPPMSAQTTRPRSTKPKASSVSSSAKPVKPKAIAIIDAIDKNANKTKFDATREFGDYEKEFPKHEVDGMIGRDSADLPKMREQMKKVIKMAQASGIRERDIISLSDSDLQQIWSTLNAKKDPETRAQFLLMMLADFELGMRKLSADRAKNGPAQYEDAAKVKQIVDYMKKKGRV